MDYLRPVFAEIDIDNIINNYNVIKKRLETSVSIMAVVKADAYGHGAVEVSKELQQAGVEWFGVAFLGEALELRRNGITKPILVMGWTPPADYELALENNIALTIFTVKDGEILSELALSFDKRATIHIKIDTGMGRLGFLADETVVEAIKKLFNLKGLNIEGVFTHFAKSEEENLSFTNEQVTKFTEIVSQLENDGYYFKYKHAANSAAILAVSKTWLNMVRLGVSLYGLLPADDTRFKKYDLKPALELKALVSHVKSVDKDFPVSYSSKFVTSKKSVLATIPVGYADGYLRKLSQKGQILIKGKFAPIVGTICMDQFVCDVTDLGFEVVAGDLVTLIGKDVDNEISVDNIAQKLDTINYEVICSISNRVPRVYKKNNRI